MKQKYAIGVQRSSSGELLLYVRPISVPIEDLLKETRLNDKELIAAHRYIASVEFSIEQDTCKLALLILQQIS